MAFSLVKEKEKLPQSPQSYLRREPQNENLKYDKVRLKLRV